MGKRHLKSLRNFIKAHSKKEGSFKKILDDRMQESADLNPIEKILDETKYFWFKKKNWNKTLPSVVSMMLVCVLLVYQNCGGGAGGGAGGAGSETTSSALKSVLIPEYSDNCTPRISPTSGGIRVSCSVSGALLYGAQVSIAGKSCKDVVVVDKSRFYCDVPANPAGVYDIQITNTDSKTVHLQKAFAYQDSPLYLQSYSIYHGQSRLIEALGGVKPYFYYIESGKGTINTSTGEFTAPQNYEGDTKVFVLDSIGQKYSSQISIGSLPLALSPSVANIVPGGNIQLTPQGGLQPYTFSIISGGGEIDDTGNFTVPLGASTGETKIKLTDFKGRATISTMNIAAIAIAPSQTELAISNTVQLTVSGGKAPYRFELSNANGAINSEKVFTANVAGETKIRVYDSYGAYADSVITIRPSLSVTPMNSKLLIGQKTQFSISGGVPPYRINGTGGGVFDSGFNYSATNEGTWNYDLIDKLGNKVTIKSEVKKTLSVTFTSPMRLQSQQTLAVTGGFPPYRFQADNTETGTINETGVYTSNLNTASSRVTVLDSLNNSSSYVLEKVLPSLTYTGSTTMPSYGNMALKVTGPYPPYSATITSGGSIDSQNTVCSPWTMEPIHMTITDATGYSKDFEILKSSTVISLPTAAYLSNKGFVIDHDGSMAFFTQVQTLHYLNPCGQKIWELQTESTFSNSSLYNLTDDTFLLNSFGKLQKIRKKDGVILKELVLDNWDYSDRLSVSNNRIIYSPESCSHRIYNSDLIEVFRTAPSTSQTGCIASFGGTVPTGHLVFHSLNGANGEYLQFFDNELNSFAFKQKLNLSSTLNSLSCAFSENQYVFRIYTNGKHGIHVSLSKDFKTQIPDFDTFRVIAFSSHENTATVIGENEIFQLSESGEVLTSDNFTWNELGADKLGKILAERKYCIATYHNKSISSILNGLVLSDGTKLYKYNNDGDRQ